MLVLIMNYDKLSGMIFCSWLSSSSAILIVANLSQASTTLDHPDTCAGDSGDVSFVFVEVVRMLFSLPI